MTNETTASQPKSIGDDAQFLDLAQEYRGATVGGLHKAFKVMAAYIDNKLRAPAAQASATIQAAPKLQRWTFDHGMTASAADDGQWVRYADVLHAATIQEPVMVAEPVGENINGPMTEAQKQEARCLYRNLHHLGPDAMEDVVRFASVCGYTNGRKDFAEPAAPMVADPAGVAVKTWEERAAPDTSYWGEGSPVPYMQAEINDLRTALAATVKAVPSEALDAARYRFLRDQNIFQEVGSSSPYAVRGQSMEMLDGPELDKAIDDAKNFAAPLADKTGGGE